MESIIKLRNYKPQTNFLDGLFYIEQAQPGSINHLIENKLELVSDDYKIDPKLMDPKKVDWDLKRRIEDRMEKLEKQTRKSIARHINNKRNN